MHRWILFDWGDTLMRTLPYPGPMCTWPRVEALPGALEMLQALAGRAGIALATNAVDSVEQEIWKALARAGLDRQVERIFCFKSVGHKKASPAFFAHVMQELALCADHLVMVGDDFDQDVTAANAVGIQAVWFNERTPELRTGTSYRTVHQLSDLPALLDRWGVLDSGKP